MDNLQKLNPLRPTGILPIEIVHCHLLKPAKSVFVFDRLNGYLGPGFFNYNKGGNADPNFLNMGEAAGLRGDYGNEIKPVLRDLVGKELMVYVVHRYRNGQRRERVIDFKPFNATDEFDEKSGPDPIEESESDDFSGDDDPPY